MVQRLLVGASDIHARTPAYGLEPLEHLDVACGVTGLGPTCAPAATRCLAGEPTGFGQIREQVLARIFSGAFFGCCFGGFGHASHDGGDKRISHDYATASAAA